MTSWAYHATRRSTDAGHIYEVREVYVDEAGNITAWTEEAITPSGDTLPELWTDLERMVADTASRQILDLDTGTWLDEQEPR